MIEEFNGRLDDENHRQQMKKTENQVLKLIQNERLKAMKSSMWMGLVVMGLWATVASANPIEITDTAGVGSSSAFMAINFSDGAQFNFQVSFDGTIKGEALLDLLDAETDLNVIYEYYTNKENKVIRYVDGFSYGDHVNQGFAGGENWWHYWTADSLKPNGKPDWVYSNVGCSERDVVDGSWDGWVYGRASTPYVPEPATIGSVSLGLMLLRNRSRKLS